MIGINTNQSSKHSACSYLHSMTEDNFSVEHSVGKSSRSNFWMFLRLAQNYETLKSKSKTNQEMGLSRVLLKHSGKVLNTLLKHQRKPPPLNSKVAWECVKSAIQLISPSQLNFHHDLLKRGNTNVLKVVFSHSWKADQAKLSSLADGR